jgi:hypothetical protein
MELVSWFSELTRQNIVQKQKVGQLRKNPQAINECYQSAIFLTRAHHQKIIHKQFNPISKLTSILMSQGVSSLQVWQTKCCLHFPSKQQFS